MQRGVGKPQKRNLPAEASSHQCQFCSVKLSPTALRVLPHMAGGCDSDEDFSFRAGNHAAGRGFRIKCDPVPTVIHREVQQALFLEFGAG